MHIIDDTDLDSMLEFRFDEGVQKGKELGREEGIAEGKAEVARKMLEDGMPDDVVAKYTGLSMEEIGSLK